MNKPTKLALVNLNKAPLYALFHSTPVFDSRLRTQWESGWHELKECFRNLLDGLQRFYGPRPNSKGDHGWPQKKGFHLYEEEYEVEVETIFRSAYGCNVGFYFWSLINDESPRNSSGYYYYYSNKSYYWYNNYNYNNNNNNDNYYDNNNNNDYKKNRSSRKKRRWFEDDEDDEKDKDKDQDEDDKPAKVKTDLRKERIALGLSDSGPLSLEDVKNAYRACALKWHPDRHSGSFKAIAEAKFKVCNTAYQSLCDKLGPK